MIIILAHLEDEKQLERLQPKKYSKKLIEEFEKKRKLEKEQNELKILRGFFNYPNDWLKNQQELPPSLKLINSNMLKKDYLSNCFWLK